MAHEEGDLHSFAAALGNDVAIKTYREGKLLFPDGTIIVALHYRHVPSEENNKVFGRDQSFVAGSPTNIQFMVKDAKKYAATGGVGVRSLPRRQTFNRRGDDENLLRPPPTDQRSRPCLHALRTITQKMSINFWLSAEERCGEQNAIWTCQNCGKMFADSGGWGWAAYDAASDTFTPAVPADQPPQGNDAKCGLACHTIATTRDYVFTDYQRR